MLHPKMFEVVGTIPRLPNFLRFSIRKNATSARTIKRLMKEDKENFGPLLETAREKRRPGRPAKSRTAVDLEKIEVNRKSLAELSWTIGSTKAENLKFVRKTKEDNFNVIKIKKLSRLSQLLGSNPYTHNCGADITNLVINEVSTKSEKEVNENDKKNSDNTKEINRIPKAEEFVPFSEEKVVRTADDDVLTDDDTSYASESFTTPVSNDSLYFPIINKSKPQDTWQGEEIVSLKPAENNQVYLPGVTRILNETMSEEGKLMLEKWKKRMTLELGEEGFREYCEKLLEDSKMMHQLIEKTLKRESLPDVPLHLKPSYNSIKLILKDLTDVRMIESHVVHPQLGYRGFIDCVANYRGNLCIIDWKKSEKIKTLSTTYDSPLQVSAYIGALNADPNYPFQVKSGLLAIAYTRGQPPSAFEFSAARLEFYWREWLKRLEKYKSMKKL